MIILAIDPGPEHSGWVVYSGGEVLGCDTGTHNDELKEIVSISDLYNVLAVEWFESYGMPVGATVFEAVAWVGRFEQAALHRKKVITRITRSRCALELCQTKRAKESALRQRLIDLHGGDRRAAIGIKKAQGPLYSVKGHAWSALAVAYTASQMLNPAIMDTLTERTTNDPRQADRGSV